MNERINEINQILEQRNAELESCDNLERMTAIESEVNSLIAERDRLVAVEERKAHIRSIFQNTEDISIDENSVSNRSQVQLDQMNLRQKASYALGKMFRGKEFNEVEKRALNQITTTADEFSAATASTVGQNNGGVFINTKVLFDLLIEEKLVSPMFADIVMDNIPGKLEYVYRDRKNIKAAGKKETEGNTKDQQYEFKTLKLADGWLQSSNKVTDEVLALSDFNLGSYLLSTLIADFDEDYSFETIYATGENDSEGNKHIKGIVSASTPVTYTDYTKGVVDALTSLDKRKRKGAKVYVAQDVYDAILFATDANGNFKYPVFNNSTGISSIGTARLVLDETLRDGDIIAGNVAKWFKVNILLGTTVESDRDKKKKVTEYIISTFVAAAPAPGAFAYYKKGTASTPATPAGH